MIKIVLCLVIFNVLCASSYAEPYKNTIVATFAKCPITSATHEAVPIALAAAIAPKLIEATVDVVANAIKIAAEDKDAIKTGAGSSHFYQTDGRGSLNLSPSVQCITIVSGEFYGLNDKNYKTSNFSHPLFKSKSKDLADLKLTKEPEFYFEGALETSDDSNAFKIIPKFVYVNEFFENSFINNERNIFLTLSFATPSSDSDKSPFASSVIMLNDIKEQTTIYFPENELNYSSTPWMPMYPQNDNTNKIIEAEKQVADDLSKTDDIINISKEVADIRVTAAQNELCKLLKASGKNDDADCDDSDITIARKKLTELKTDVDVEKKKAAAIKHKSDIKLEVKSIAPVNIKCAIKETRKGNATLQFISKLFESSKEDIKTALKTELIKSEKTKKEDTENEAVLKKNEKVDQYNIDALTAKNEVDISEAALKSLKTDATAEERTKAETTVLLAKLRANIAYRKANKKELYPGVF